MKQQGRKSTGPQPVAVRVFSSPTNPPCDWRQKHKQAILRKWTSQQPTSELSLLFNHCTVFASEATLEKKINNTKSNNKDIKNV